MRVLVCGGRDFRAEQWLKEELCDLVWQRRRFKGVTAQVTTIIHGAASGADQMAGQFAIGTGLKVEEFRADWQTHGKAAGPIRNKRMLDQGKPDLVVAFPGGRGTANMISQAEAAGVPVIRVTVSEKTP